MDLLKWRSTGRGTMEPISLCLADSLHCAQAASRDTHA